MKKLLFVLFALALVLGDAPLKAHSLANSLKDKDEEREIPLDPCGSLEGGPITRGVVIQAANAYLNDRVITVVFNQELPSASVSVSSTSDGVNVYSETLYSPEFITINLSSEDAGEYHLEIEAGGLRLSGNFAL